MFGMMAKKSNLGFIIPYTFMCEISSVFLQIVAAVWMFMSEWCGFFRSAILPEIPDIWRTRRVAKMCWTFATCQKSLQLPQCALPSKCNVSQKWNSNKSQIWIYFTQTEHNLSSGKKRMCFFKMLSQYKSETCSLPLNSDNFSTIQCNHLPSEVT